MSRYETTCAACGKIVACTQTGEYTCTCGCREEEVEDKFYCKISKWLPEQKEQANG